MIEIAGFLAIAVTFAMQNCPLKSYLRITGAVFLISAASSYFSINWMDEGSKFIGYTTEIVGAFYFLGWLYERVTGRSASEDFQAPSTHGY